jgi:hypothetical protein
MCAWFTVFWTHRISPPHIPEDDELAELAEELQSQIQVLMPDAAWLQPLWMVRLDRTPLLRFHRIFLKQWSLE